jgi:hypothetical protein
LRKQSPYNLHHEYINFDIYKNFRLVLECPNLTLIKSFLSELRMASNQHHRSLSPLFIWANLNPRCVDTLNEGNSDPYSIPECFAIQFIRQIEDPMYRNEMLDRPTMVMALFDYFTTPQKNSGNSFADLGREAVTKFLSKPDVLQQMLDSRDVSPFLMELISEKLDEFDKFEILKSDGALSAIFFYRKAEELAGIMENMSDHLVESLLELPQTIIAFERYDFPLARPDYF